MRSKQSNELEGSTPYGTLHVVATPIGHLADITLRALETLRSVRLIAAEDTRHTRKLLTHYDIHKPLVSYHSHNAGQRGPELLRRLLAGEDVALVTDAGTPGISDPGGLLVHEALEHGVSVSVIPGPSAVISALVASGLPSHPFAFLGFPPPRGTARNRFFVSHSTLPMTLVLYESPRRLFRTLEDILQFWGDRDIAVARELTKRHEEVFRGKVSEALAHFAEGTKGELTLVAAGRDEQPLTNETSTEWREELRRFMDESHLKVKEAAEAIVARHGISRRLVYQEALKMKR